MGGSRRDPVDSAGNSVMNVDAEETKRSFSAHDGRDVFENGGVKLWRCPVCAWWRPWPEPRCCGCGLKRDLPALYKTAGIAV
jgi:hypothetical protein